MRCGRIVASTISSSRLAAVAMRRSVTGMPKGRERANYAGLRAQRGDSTHTAHEHRSGSAVPLAVRARVGVRSNLHLRPELDQPIAGNLEKRRGRRRVALHENEELVAPTHHAGTI